MRLLQRRGFSLVEILIVVMIIGILATIVIPRFSSATADSQEASIRTSLQSIRRQIELFRLEHGGTPPQAQGMWTLLTKTTDTTETNVTNPTGTAHGPYMIQPPVNPWNGLTTVDSASTADTLAGWYYTAGASTYELRARNIDGSVNHSY